eukprot:Rmarinus@m.734
MKGLEEFSAAYNMLPAVPAGLLSLPRLTHIYLQHNNIASLPEGPLPTSLVLLDLSHNSISSIPDTWFTSFLHLQEFSVSHNQLRSLPESVATVPTLATLRADHNPINTLPSNLLVGARISLLEISGTNVNQAMLEEAAGFREYEERRRERIAKASDVRVLD